MTSLGGHVTIFSQVPAQTLDEFRVNMVQGGAPGQLVPFRAVVIGVSKYKYAVRRAPLKQVFLQLSLTMNNITVQLIKLPISTLLLHLFYVTFFAINVQSFYRVIPWLFDSSGKDHIY